MYRIFYNIARMPNHVPSGSAVPMDIADVHSDIFPLLKEDGEFLGIVDEAGTRLQLIYEADDDLYWSEVPSPGEGGSYGKGLTFDEARELIGSVSGGIPPRGYEGFYFVSWNLGCEGADLPQPRR